jgi:hypothetical protein
MPIFFDSKEAWFEIGLVLNTGCNTWGGLAVREKKSWQEKKNDRRIEEEEGRGETSEITWTWRLTMPITPYSLQIVAWIGHGRNGNNIFVFVHSLHVFEIG